MSRHNRRVVALTTAGILAAALLAAGGWWLGQRAEQPPVATGVTAKPSTTPPVIVSPPATTTRPTPTSPAQAGTWRRLPTAPISGRFAPAAVWTGRQMLVWGGRGRIQNPVTLLDGAAYDPATGRWQRIPDAPQFAQGSAQAVWTGSRMLVWMGNAPDGPAVGATYDPASRSWQLIATSPLGPRENYTTTWTGSELLIYGGSSGDAIATPAAAAYNPTSDRWRLLPTAPIAPRVAHAAVWTGQEMLIWGGYTVANGKTVRFGDGAAYNPRSNNWRPIAKRTPGLARAAAWTGSRMLVWTDTRTATGATTGALYDPARDRWTSIGPGPAITDFLSRPVWTGSELIAWEADGAGGRFPDRGIAYNPAAERWRILPRAPLATRNGLGRFGTAVVWTGKEALIWSGRPTSGPPDAPFTDGAAYRPATL